jgi:cytochrome b561
LTFRLGFALAAFAFLDIRISATQKSHEDAHPTRLITWLRARRPPPIAVATAPPSAAMKVRAVDQALDFFAFLMPLSEITRASSDTATPFFFASFFSAL